MAQLNREAISCSICLNLLKDPVAIPCGHIYCLSCINTRWDGGDEKVIYSCPQCRQMFTPRPVLMKGITFVDVNKEPKRTGLQAAADHSYSGAEDVTCDVCTGRKMKAVKSCLQCLVSYCETHLHPHYVVAQFKRHKLVEPSKKLQDNVCSRHGEVMKMFCRTDQQCICYLCPVDEHKGHETVSAAAERAERQRELEASQQKIQAKIQDKEKDVKVLQREAEVRSRSADKTEEYSEKIFIQLIRLMEKRRSDVKRQIRSRQETEASQVKELQEKLEQEIIELRDADAELREVLHIEDHNKFLHSCSSRPKVRKPAGSSSINMLPLCYFEDVTAAVSELRANLHRTLNEEWTNVLKYSCEVTLDPNTAQKYMSVCEGGRRVTLMRQKQRYPHHPDRFSGWQQILSKDSLTGRCYWEVEWSGTAADVAVAYKNIKRDGSHAESQFGGNDRSWALNCNNNCYVFQYNGVSSPVLGPPSSRIGVYLDHRAGILSFYSISETMTLLHRVQTTFTQPLHAGLRLHLSGDTAKLTKLTLMSAV